LGEIGCGRGTLCAYFAESKKLIHYSVGDGLRSWMHADRDAPLAVTIQDKLDNQGFLASEELNPFICQAIPDAMGREPKAAGIPIDGFPRSTEQLESWSVWLFPDDLPLAGEPKFEKRFSEYKVETLSVEETYGQHVLLHEPNIDANGTKEENVNGMASKLDGSELWRRVMVEGRADAHFQV
ncbi:hypothetical protein EJ02DRAFT_490768, partial [Clathrospora elynae]